MAVRKRSNPLWHLWHPNKGHQILIAATIILVTIITITIITITTITTIITITTITNICLSAKRIATVCCKCFPEALPSYIKRHFLNVSRILVSW